MKTSTEAPNPAALRIVEAARRHFLQHGFRSVSMDDLAEAMGMSKKTLYVHFKTKRELLAAVIERKLRDLEAAMDSVPSGGTKEFAATLHRLLTGIRQQAQEISPTFARDLAREEPGLFERIKSKRREVIGRTFTRILSVGQKAKRIRRDIPADILVEILVGLADSVAVPDKVAARGMAPGEMLTIVLKVFLDGVQTQKGASSL
jgi:AcrR family transcriptional regulator